MNYIKQLLSKSTKEWVIFLVLNFLFLSTLFAIPLFSIPSILAMIVYSIVIAWFLAGTIRKFLFNLFSFLGVLALSSVACTMLEPNHLGITSTFLPSVFFLYFGLLAGIEFINKTFKYKALMSFTITALNIAIVFLIFIYTTNITNYLSLFISTLLLVFSLGIFFLYSKKDKITL